MRFAGRASGRQPARVAAGPLPRASRRAARSTVAPPAGVRADDRVARRRAGRRSSTSPPRVGAVRAAAAAAHLPIAGELTYRFEPGPVELEAAAGSRPSGRTSRFEGTTAWARRVAIPVPRHERRLAGERSGAGRHHRPISERRPAPVTFGGRGEFDGVHDRPFRRPRVEGRVQRRGHARVGHHRGATVGAHIVVENSYVTVRDGIVRRGDSEIRADGCSRSAIPRRDGGEEIDARFRVDAAAMSTASGTPSRSTTIRCPGCCPASST